MVGSVPVIHLINDLNDNFVNQNSNNIPIDTIDIVIKVDLNTAKAILNCLIVFLSLFISKTASKTLLCIIFVAINMPVKTICLLDCICDKTVYKIKKRS
jgi:hypothetical protein